MLWQCAKQDTAKNFFPLPNEIFLWVCHRENWLSTPTCSSVRTARLINVGPAIRASAEPFT